MPFYRVVNGIKNIRSLGIPGIPATPLESYPDLLLMR
jgi:hypothetical protein